MQRAPSGARPLPRCAARSATTSPSARGHVDRLIIDAHAAIARQFVRPPDLAGIQRQHRDPPLESHHVDVLCRRPARPRIDIDKALKLGAPVRRRSAVVSHCTEPSLHADRDHLAVVETGHDHARPRSPGESRATQRQSRHRLLAATTAHGHRPGSGRAACRHPVRRAISRSEIAGGASTSPLMRTFQRSLPSRALSAITVARRLSRRRAIAVAADGAPRERRLGARPPLRAPVVEVEARPRRPCGPRHRRDSPSTASPGRGAARSLLVVRPWHSRGFCDAQRRGEWGELGGLIEVLVLGAGDQQEHGRKPGPGCSCRMVAHFALDRPRRPHGARRRHGRPGRRSSDPGATCWPGRAEALRAAAVLAERRSLVALGVIGIAAHLVIARLECARRRRASGSSSAASGVLLRDLHTRQAQARHQASSRSWECSATALQAREAALSRSAVST